MYCALVYLLYGYGCFAPSEGMTECRWSISKQHPFQQTWFDANKRQTDYDSAWLLRLMEDGGIYFAIITSSKIVNLFNIRFNHKNPYALGPILVCLAAMLCTRMIINLRETSHSQSHVSSKSLGGSSDSLFWQVQVDSGHGSLKSAGKGSGIRTLVGEKNEGPVEGEKD